MRTDNSLALFLTIAGGCSLPSAVRAGFSIEDLTAFAALLPEACNGTDSLITCFTGNLQECGACFRDETATPAVPAVLPETCDAARSDGGLQDTVCALASCCEPCADATLGAGECAIQEQGIEGCDVECPDTGEAGGGLIQLPGVPASCVDGFKAYSDCLGDNVIKCGLSCAGALAGAAGLIVNRPDFADLNETAAAEECADVESSVCGILGCCAACSEQAGVVGACLKTEGYFAGADPGTGPCDITCEDVTPPDLPSLPDLPDLPALKQCSTDLFAWGNCLAAAAEECMTCVKGKVTDFEPLPTVCSTSVALACDLKDCCDTCSDEAETLKTCVSTNAVFIPQGDDGENFVCDITCEELAGVDPRELPELPGLPVFEQCSSDAIAWGKCLVGAAEECKTCVKGKVADFEPLPTVCSTSVALACDLKDCCGDTCSDEAETLKTCVSTNAVFIPQGDDGENFVCDITCEELAGVDPLELPELPGLPVFEQCSSDVIAWGKCLVGAAEECKTCVKGMVDDFEPPTDQDAETDCRTSVALTCYLKDCCGTCSDEAETLKTCVSSNAVFSPQGDDSENFVCNITCEDIDEKEPDPSEGADTDAPMSTPVPEVASPTPPPVGGNGTVAPTDSGGFAPFGRSVVPFVTAICVGMALSLL